MYHELREELELIKENQKLITENQTTIYRSLPSPVTKYVMYVALGIAMVASIRSCNRTEEQLTLQIENVIGQEAPEQFYEIIKMHEKHF